MSLEMKVECEICGCVGDAQVDRSEKVIRLIDDAVHSDVGGAPRVRQERRAHAQRPRRHR